ncbi:MAG: stage II sporulation protein M [Actinomycetota bacterium]|nr:stage II sporulation protein M [Actinomycetota bacterium]
MDLDSYLIRHEPAWDRLATLTGKARREPTELSTDELDDLVLLYQRASSELSHSRRAFADSGLDARLTRLVAEAHAVLRSRRSGSRRQAFVDFLAIGFPAAVWWHGRYIAVSAALTLGPFLILGAWLANSDAALDAAAPEAVRQAYIEEDFEAYYSSEPAAGFSTSVLVNNIQVSVLALAGGVLAGIGTIVILVQNGANIGLALGMFASVGEQPRFWGLILPHGLLELTAVIIAGAAGLALGWAIVAPGDRSRADALAEAGRRSVTVIGGLALAFVVAGIIEGFVTPSPLPTGVRVGIGVAVETAFLLYLFALGRRAAADGATGLLGEQP